MQKCFIGKTLLKKFEKVGGQNPIDAARLGCGFIMDHIFIISRNFEI